MIAPLSVDMKEVARLTRAGRLPEAIALLGSALKKPDMDDKLAAPVSGEGSQSPAASIREVLRSIAKPLGKAGAWPGTPSPAPSVRVREQPLPVGGSFEVCSFANEVGRLDYKLYVPSRDVGEPRPLLVMLHGCAQSPDDFAAGTRMNEVAEAHGFLVAYPAQTQAANASRCWNWFKTADQQRDGGEPALIAGITRQVMRDFAVDPARVYVAGLSAGGAAAVIMGSVYPDLYAAVGVHSGLACGAATDMASAFAAMRGTTTARPARTGQTLPSPMPTIVFHGDRDDTVNAINAGQVIAQAKAGAVLETTTTEGKSTGGMDYTRRVETNLAGEPVVEQWILHGAGHAWSGGSDAGSFTEPRGPDASREMARFFLQHSKRRARPAAKACFGDVE